MAGFDEVKASFWSDSAYGALPPLTGVAISEAEGSLGLRLPGSLLELLWVQNGGVVSGRWNAFRTGSPTSWSSNHVPLRAMFGIGSTDCFGSLLYSPYLVREWGMPSPVVLLSGEGPFWIALDYRVVSTGEPAVTWFDQDDNEERLLAKDFRSFVEGLTAASQFTEGS